MSISIPREVAQHLGYYVYMYIDPRTSMPFYVGKGKGNRVLAHLGAASESRKAQMLHELADLGLEPRLDILAHGLADEQTAFRIEAAVIDVLGLDTLTNEVRGWRSVQLGRMPLSQLIAYYAAKPIEIVDPVILIRGNRRYWHGMPALELYEVTRGVWKVGERRTRAKYAFAVFEAVVREVYTIGTWHEAGTTPYKTRTLDDVTWPGRWEFTGTPAAPDIRSRYLYRSVSKYLQSGSQNPIAYVNI